MLSLSVKAGPNTTHKLRVVAKPEMVQNMGEPRYTITHPRTTSMANTRIQWGRCEWDACSLDIEPVPVSISPPMILISIVRKTSVSVDNSAENCFNSRNTTRVERKVRGNIGFSERVLSNKGQRRCRSSSSISTCCENTEIQQITSFRKKI